MAMWSGAGLAVIKPGQRATLTDRLDLHPAARVHHVDRDAVLAAVHPVALRLATQDIFAVHYVHHRRLRAVLQSHLPLLPVLLEVALHPDDR
jgi:hypothetical protein